MKCHLLMYLLGIKFIVFSILCRQGRAFLRFFVSLPSNTYSKIRRQDSGGDLPPVGKFQLLPGTPRVNSFQSVAMDDVMESGNLGPYQERLRTFPNMRSKPYTPLVRITFRASHFMLFTFVHLTIRYMQESCHTHFHLFSVEV